MTVSAAFEPSKKSLINPPETNDNYLRQDVIGDSSKPVSAYKNVDLAHEWESFMKNHFLLRGCPYCGARHKDEDGNPTIIKRGKQRNGYQRYLCKKCQKRFIVLTGTFLEQTTFGPSYWTNLIWLEINSFSLVKEKIELFSEPPYAQVTEQTILNQRLALMSACAQLQPEMYGKTEIDECHIREAQKGTQTHLNHKLVNYASSSVIPSRMARKRATPSYLGCRGAEFITIATMVDDDDNYSAYVTGFGAMTQKQFEDKVEPHLKETTFLCSDGNKTYAEWADKNGIPHYIIPSQYHKNMASLHDHAAKEKAFKEGRLDSLNNMGHPIPTFAEMVKIRKEFNLTLNKVNSFHSLIKERLTIGKRGVNLEYAQAYLDWICYLKNLTNIIGHTPSSMADAEYFLADLLYRSLAKDKETVREIRSRNGKDLKTPSNIHQKYVRDVTNKIRDITENHSYALTDEDIGGRYSLKRQIDLLPLYQLKEIGKNLKIKGYSKATAKSNYKLRSDILRHPDVQDELTKVLAKYQTAKNSTLRQ